LFHCRHSIHIVDTWPILNSVDTYSILVCFFRHSSYIVNNHLVLSTNHCVLSTFSLFCRHPFHHINTYHFLCSVDSQLSTILKFSLSTILKPLLSTFLKCFLSTQVIFDFENNLLLSTVIVCCRHCLYIVDNSGYLVDRYLSWSCRQSCLLLSTIILTDLIPLFCFDSIPSLL